MVVCVSSWICCLVSGVDGGGGLVLWGLISLLIDWVAFFLCGYERERERERDRQTDRQTEGVDGRIDRWILSRVAHDFETCNYMVPEATVH